MAKFIIERKTVSIRKNTFLTFHVQEKKRFYFLFPSVLKPFFRLVGANIFSLLLSTLPQLFLVLRKKHWAPQSSTEKRSKNKWSRTYYWPFSPSTRSWPITGCQMGWLHISNASERFSPSKRVAGSVFSSKKKTFFIQEKTKKKKTWKQNNRKKRKKQKHAIDPSLASPGIPEKNSERKDTYKKLPRGPVFKKSDVVAKKTSGLPRENKHDEKLPNLHENYSQRVE